MLNYKKPIRKTATVAFCLVAAVSLTVIANPAAVYANDKPIEPSTTPISVAAPTAPLLDPTAAPTSSPASQEIIAVPLLGEEGSISIITPLGEGAGYVSAGMKSYTGHTGTDFAAPAGTEIYAAQSGTVVYASNDIDDTYGKYVIVDHGDGWQTLYAHCNDVIAEVDDKVAQGDLIAKVGRTGNVTGNHCHVELRINGEAVDPEDYIVKAE